ARPRESARLASRRRIEGFEDHARFEAIDRDLPTDRAHREELPVGRGAPVIAITRGDERGFSDPALEIPDLVGVSTHPGEDGVSAGEDIGARASPSEPGMQRWSGLFDAGSQREVGLGPALAEGAPVAPGPREVLVCDRDNRVRFIADPPRPRGMA